MPRAYLFLLLVQSWSYDTCGPNLSGWLAKVALLVSQGFHASLRMPGGMSTVVPA